MRKIDKRTENDIYQTSNLSLASFLYASSIEFIGITKTEGKSFFNFYGKDKAGKLVGRFYAGSASVNPRELFARLNDLKDLIFSGGRL